MNKSNSLILDVLLRLNKISYLFFRLKSQSAYLILLKLNFKKSLKVKETACP
jgi:hypothetical protein